MVKDGEVIRLGRTAITGRATPGHTMGSMSWSWQACEVKQCKAIVFASSLNPVSADGYRCTASASVAILRGFKTSYKLMDRLACDILISAHPDDVGEARYSDKLGGFSRGASALVVTTTANRLHRRANRTARRSVSSRTTLAATMSWVGETARLCFRPTVPSD